MYGPYKKHHSNIKEQIDYAINKYPFDKNIINLLKVYEEFLVLNKGFVNSELNTDIQIPESVKTENAEKYKEQIEEALKAEDLSKLLEYLPTII